MDIEDLIERVDGNINLDSFMPADPIRKYKIHDKPFAKGAERLCFMAVDQRDQILQVRVGIEYPTAS